MSDIKYKFSVEADKETIQEHMDTYNYKHAICEFAEFLRREIKYTGDKYNDAEYKLLDDIHTEFYKVLNDNGVEL